MWNQKNTVIKIRISIQNGSELREKEARTATIS